MMGWGSRIKKNIMRVQRKGALPKKGAWTVYRFNGGLGEKWGSVFEGVGSQCTLWKIKLNHTLTVSF